MPTYKLTYFNIPCLGEPIRFILSYMGVDFEDNRVSFKDWPALKPKMPIGQMPILDIDGKKIIQSASICRYLAPEANLDGANRWENLQIDITVDTITDYRLTIGAYLFEEVPEMKEKKRLKLLNETTPFYMSKLDEQVKANGGYLANGKLSWADFYHVGFSETCEHVLNDNFIERYPNLKKHRETIWALPQIKAWLEKRPESEPIPLQWNR